ncbi:MAG: hypothetical protein KDE56_17425, partial [Anaerolineales bacterium]|nr:hypothetical protein [Anaerolineales bacterium]
MADDLLGDTVGFLFVGVVDGIEGHFALHGQTTNGTVAEHLLQRWLGGGFLSGFAGKTAVFLSTL